MMKNPPSTGNPQGAVFLWILGVLDSCRFQIAGALLFAGMLIFAPIASIPFFRVCLTGEILLLTWSLLQKRRKPWLRRLLPVAGAAAVTAVWLLSPNVAGFFAVAGWLILSGVCRIRAAARMKSAGTARSIRILERILGGVMLLLGKILLVRSGSMDYLESVRGCAIGVLATALAALPLDGAIFTHRKRSSK